MTGPKLNERSFVAGERSGTKASAKYVRTSASKAREVLDLIRDLDVRTADQVLQFTERHVARDVRKVLASAVANAVNNDLQDADELYVVACFADEGPTIKRFRPRARGRASRINKRSCHITVIVARMSDDRIAVLQAREERAGGQAGRGRPQSSAASRRARVARSRGEDAADEQAAAETVDAAEDAPTDATTDATTDAGADETPETPEGLVPGAYPGSVQPLDDAAEVPDGYEVKGNEGSMLYHEPGSRYYKATKAEVWFDSVESAEAAGFSKPGTKKDTADASTPAEGSASDEADASRGGSEADDEGATEKGSASDETTGGEGSASDETTGGEGSASDETDASAEDASTDDDNTAEGSASDEADASRGGSEADDEGAN